MDDEKQLLYINIKKYLLKLIDENKHIQNYKLPSENQLAVKFNASRISSKKALNLLQQEGIIYRIQGKGTFINNNINLHKDNERINEYSINKNNLIALLIPGIGSRFNTNIIKGVKQHLEENNFKVILMITDSNQEKEKEYIKTVLDLNCKGIIIFPCDNQIYNPEILELSINKFPTVLVDRKLKGIEISYVASNHFKSAFNVTKYLVNNGHEKIGFISPAPKVASSILERIDGYEKALSSSIGFKDNLRLVISNEVEKRNEQIRNYLINHKNITAVISEGGNVGLDLIKNIYDLGLKCPEDIDIVLYDNEFDKYMDFLPCKPIIVEQNPYEIGNKAAQVVCELIKSNNNVYRVMIDEVLQKNIK